jgi:hypothetical protein
LNHLLLHLLRHLLYSHSLHPHSYNLRLDLQLQLLMAMLLLLDHLSKHPLIKLFLPMNLLLRQLFLLALLLLQQLQYPHNHCPRPYNLTAHMKLHLSVALLLLLDLLQVSLLQILAVCLRTRLSFYLCLPFSLH